MASLGLLNDDYRSRNCILELSNQDDKHRLAGQSKLADQSSRRGLWLDSIAGMQSGSPILESCSALRAVEIVAACYGA